MSKPRLQQTALARAGEIELFERDMTATISAEVPLQAVQRHLAKVNQWLPIDGDPSLPVGELVERNSTGPLRLGYGGWRDLLLGVQFTNGRGDLITAGGRPVKNVAGYDLTKFMVGQSGTLGKIVTITTRTYRRPVDAILATFEADVRMLNRLLPTPLKPRWAMLMPAALCCGYLGDQRTLHYYAVSLAKVADPRPISIERRSLGEDMAHRFAAFGRQPEEAWYFRASVPPMRIAEFVGLCRPRRWAADPAHGIVAGVTDEVGGIHRTGEAASAVSGRIIYDGAGSNESLLRPGAEMDIIRKLKAAFDPENKLRPLPVSGGGPF